MRFQVPQFIEHEPKVIGPLTFRQFIYLGVPGTIAFFLYFLAPFFVFVAAAIFLGAFGLAFAFLKMGGRSLPSIIVSFFNFTIAPKRYLWQKGKIPAQAAPRAQYQQPASPAGGQPEQQFFKQEIKFTQKSRVRDLATRVETNK